MSNTRWAQFIAAFLVFYAVVVSAANAEKQSGWHISEEIDSMNDMVKKSASIVNNEGHKLSVYRGPNNAAWMLFSLSDSVFDTISSSRAPMYRIDKNEPHSLESSRQLSSERTGLRLYAWEPKWINFIIWHGNEAQGRSVSLKEFMTGQSVVFRYTVGTGGYKETIFSLNGAGTAIAEALGISEHINAAAEAVIWEYRRLLLEATKRCKQDMSTFRTCFSRVNECEKNSRQNNELLAQCLR